MVYVGHVGYLLAAERWSSVIMRRKFVVTTRWLTVELYEINQQVVVHSGPTGYGKQATVFGQVALKR
jgi:hypothetical protein